MQTTSLVSTCCADRPGCFQVLMWHATSTRSAGLVQSPLHLMGHVTVAAWNCRYVCLLCHPSALHYTRDAHAVMPQLPWFATTLSNLLDGCHHCASLDRHAYRTDKLQIQYVQLREQTLHGLCHASNHTALSVAKTLPDKCYLSSPSVAMTHTST